MPTLLPTPFVAETDELGPPAPLLPPAAGVEMDGARGVLASCHAGMVGRGIGIGAGELGPEDEGPRVSRRDLRLASSVRSSERL